VASRYKLHVIEDACEALGAEYNGRHVGTFGDIGVFAFYPNKQMTTAEGGMIVTDNEEIAAVGRSMRNQGRAYDAVWLCHERLGYNYRLSDIHCALGLAQLQRLDHLLNGRARVAMQYERTLAGHPLIRLPHSTPECQRSWFVYPIQLMLDCDSPGLVRDQVLRHLWARGIGSQSYFPAIHLQPYFRQQVEAHKYHLPETERASDTCMVLPMFSSATEEQIEYVCQTLVEILEAESPTQAAESGLAHSKEVLAPAS
jgi:perosamine synthetase